MIPESVGAGFAGKKSNTNSSLPLADPTVDDVTSVADDVASVTDDAASVANDVASVADDVRGFSAAAAANASGFVDKSRLEIDKCLAEEFVMKSVEGATANRALPLPQQASIPCHDGLSGTELRTRLDPVEATGLAAFKVRRQKPRLTSFNILLEKEP